MGSDPLIGKVLHDMHEIVRLIGQGGMGAVYEAVHKRLRKQRFAVKVLHQKMVDNETIFARFQREAEIATKIGHPNIVYVLDFYETDEGMPCMVMEYLEGENLGEQLKKRGKLPPHEVVELMEQLGAVGRGRSSARQEGGPPKPQAGQHLHGEPARRQDEGQAAGLRHLQDTGQWHAEGQ